MIMKHLMAACVFVLLFVQCAPQLRVYSDHDPDYQIGNFSTFNWGGKESIEVDRNLLYYSQLNDKRIKAAVSHELSDRGYQLSKNDPNMLLHYHIIVSDQSVITPDPYGYFYGPYWLHIHANVCTYEEGTLIIDIMDPKTNNLIWRGWATAALDEVDPENTQEMIGRAVSRIFQKFPDSVGPPQEIKKI